MIRRVLLSTINYDHPQKGMTRSFSGLFPQILDYDFLQLQRERQTLREINEGLISAALNFRPDWMWLQLQETNIIKPETIMRVRENNPYCVISHWMGDCRAAVGSYSAAICKATHITLLSNVGQLPLYKEAGADRAHYCQIAVDWDEDVLGIPDWTPNFRVPDVVLCGNYYGDSFPGTADRVEAVNTLRGNGVDVGIVGWGWPKGFPVVGHCQVKQQHHIWKRAKVALNVNHFNNIERYYSDRQLIAMASGTPLVCKYIPGLEAEFTQGVHCLWYRNSSELLTHVGTLLASAEMRLKMGKEARAVICQQHTWWSRILAVLPLIEEVRSSLIDSAIETLNARALLQRPW